MYVFRHPVSRMDRTGTLYDYIERDDTEASPSFQRYIENLVTEKEEPVRALTIISDRHPSDLFREATLVDFDVEIDQEGSLSNGVLTRSRESKSYENDIKTWEDSFYIVSHDEPDLYTVFTVSDIEFFEKGICRFVEQLPATISASYLSSEELRQLIQYFDNSVNGNLDVKKAVLKTTKKDTQIDYHRNKVEYYEVFNDANRESRYVDKIQIALLNAGQSFEFFIARDGTSRFVKGEISLFFNILLPFLSQTIADKDDLFSNKGREYGSRETNKIEITYEEGAIQGVEENKRLAQALKGISRSSVTIYHANPYMHASVLDFDDGTNVDIYLKSDSEISLIPGFNASRKSLNRICDQINRGFLEGEVVEADEESRNFDDYFSPA